MRGFTFTSVIVLVIVVAVVGVAAVLLARTVQEAQSINAKAQNIAVNGRGINNATDSVIQLRRTNSMARSILKSARPLDTQLNRIVSTAKGIDVRASSINATAGGINNNARSINDTAGGINSTAGDINASAGEILSAADSINASAGAISSTAGEINQSAGAISSSAGRINTSAGNINTSAGRIDSEADSILFTARQIDQDVELINRNLDVSLQLAAAVKDDTANILGQAGEANQTASCIDDKLEGPAQEDGDCESAPQAQAPENQDVGNQRMTEEEFKALLPNASSERSKESESETQTESEPAPQRPQPRLRTEVPERLTETPERSRDLVDSLLPGLRQGEGLRLRDGQRLLPDLLGRNRNSDGSPPRDLVQRLLPGLGR